MAAATNATTAAMVIDLFINSGMMQMLSWAKIGSIFLFRASMRICSSIICFRRLFLSEKGARASSQTDILSLLKERHNL